MLSWQRTGTTPRTGNKHAAMGVAPYDVYPCSDGHVALISVTNKHWRAVLEVIGRRDLLDDPRFRHNTDRAEHMSDVDDLVIGWTSQHTRDQVIGRLGGAGVPVAVVREVDEVVRDEHLIARRFLQWIDHEELGEIPLPHSPIRWHDSELRDLDPYHDVGQDNAAVYGELLGLDDVALADLRDRGVI